MLRAARYSCPESKYSREPRKKRFVAALAACVATLFVLVPCARAQSGEQRSLLKDGWAIQSSTKVPNKGADISQPGFPTGSWYSTTVPSTVVAALVDNHVYPDPYFGMNLRQFPGMNYKIGSNFSNEEMPKDSPFRVSWWYRTEFTAPRNLENEKIWLNFKGLNYRANIWLNGHQIAKAEDVAGAFRTYEFEVSAPDQRRPEKCPRRRSLSSFSSRPRHHFR